MIYLDNAATTLIKPETVINEVTDCIKYFSANSGRGGHKLSLLVGEKIYECRQNIADLFNIENPADIAFTNNTTMALNYAIKGYVKADEEVIISGMEHNSVLRPIVDGNINYKIAAADETGYVSPNNVESLITPNTRLICINHASNVVGTINPITEIGEIAKKHGVSLLVDAAQTAGVLEINVVRDNISFLAFAGHKMLYGPTGTGGLYVSPKIKNFKPIIQGGTGSLSESYSQPNFMPDMLESGTLNCVGIVGLSMGVRYVLDNTAAEIHNNETILVNRLLEGLMNIKNVKVYGNSNRVGVVGFSILGKDSVSVTNELNSDFDIATRGGLHCAVLAHKSLGTLKGGLARISVSNFTINSDIDAAIYAINKIAKG